MDLPVKPRVQNKIHEISVLFLQIYVNSKGPLHYLISWGSRNTEKKNKIVSFQLFSHIKRAYLHNSGIKIHRMYPGKVLNACSYYYKAVKPMICDTEMVSIMGLYYLLLSLFEPSCGPIILPIVKSF